MQLPGILVYIIYWRSGCSVEKFKRFLADLEHDIWCRLRPGTALLVVGDINDKSPSWGSNVLDAYGTVLELFFCFIGATASE